MFSFLERTGELSFAEKRAWIMGVVSAVAYGAYLVALLRKPAHLSLAETPYVAPMLWSIAGAIAANLLLQFLDAALSPKEAWKTDDRDQQIHRFGEYIGHSLIILAAVSALGMALADLETFWIANVLYLGFFLAAILGSVAKIVAYRRGFQPQ
ncbi:hypothetical protein HNR42_001746 [Deinobacterium chartae]|uniref:Transmembrane protein n=1 Tax=Deinobacterium chartae TaxID=521158 RepID=A0A841HXQ9_9DEIO|nr:hypothetical protein [Deinobacterium chartae]MBB6098321.1 hypothetical protein [Deinobacterium chartae]